MKTILITARDPSTAFDLKSIINYLLVEKNIFLLIIAEEPAYSIIYENTDLKSNYYKSKVILLKDFKLEDKKLKLKDNILSSKPNLILTGISGPDYGVDEICIQLSKELNLRNTFSLQSYWGDINTHFKEKPNNFFVIDKYAADITRERSPQSKIFITGNQQSKNWIDHNWVESRKNFKDKFGLDENKKIITFFSQPLCRYSFYWDTIINFLCILSKEFKEYTLIVKAHPKDENTFESKISQLCNSLNIDFIFLKEENILELISASNLTVSLYSTACYTSQIMLSKSIKPFTIPVYLFFNEEFKKFYRKTCFFYEIPMSNKNKSVIINSVDNIEKLLKLSLNTNFRIECHNSIKKEFAKNKKDPAKAVVEILLDFIK